MAAPLVRAPLAVDRESSLCHFAFPAAPTSGPYCPRIRLSSNCTLLELEMFAAAMPRVCSFHSHIRERIRESSIYHARIPKYPRALARRKKFRFLERNGS